MSPRGPGDHGNTAAALFASTFVCLVGFLGTLCIAFVYTGDATHAFLACGGSILGMAWLLWLLRDKPTDVPSRQSVFRRRRSRRAKTVRTYRPRRRPYQPHELGRNRPPTAETVRELKDGQHNWTPSGPPPRRS